MSKKIKIDTDTDGAFADDSEALEEVLKDSELEEFTEEELDIMNLGIAPEYVRGWYNKHEDAVITTQGNVRKSFLEWTLENYFTKFSDLSELEDIAITELEDYNQVLVVNKRDELKDLKPEAKDKEGKTVAMYIDKLAEERKEHQKEKDRWFREKARLQDTRDTYKKYLNSLHLIMIKIMDFTEKPNKEQIKTIKEIEEVLGE